MPALSPLASPGCARLAAWKRLKRSYCEFLHNSRFISRSWDVVPPEQEGRGTMGEGGGRGAGGRLDVIRAAGRWTRGIVSLDSTRCNNDEINARDRTRNKPLRLSPLHPPGPARPASRNILSEKLLIRSLKKLECFKEILKYKIVISHQNCHWFLVIFNEISVSTS